MLLTRIGRAGAVVVLAAATLLAGVTAATAHAGIESSSPANGAQLATAPKAITLTFAEKVRLDGKGSRLLDGAGKVVPTKVRAKGTKVTFTPQKTLPAGRYAAAWHLVSVDGDPVEGAISFTVATENPSGTPVSIATVPKVPTTLSAALPGSRTLFFSTAAKSGDVEWTSARIKEPITWVVRGSGTKAAAKGVLPTAGTWKFTATLENGSQVLVVTGKVTISG